MPAQKTTSGIAAKLGPAFGKAFNQHKNDETDYGSAGNLPEGIENGVARLAKIEVKEFNNGKLKGKPWLSFTGVVIEPAEHAGKQTRLQPIPLCNTPDRQNKKTLADHMADVLNELRKLGVNTAEMGPDDFDTTIEALNEEKPYFKFRTWKGRKQKPTDPEPEVRHDWKGYVDAPAGGGGGDEVEEETPEEEPEAEAEEAEEPAEEAGDDLDQLAEAADAGDTDSQAALEKRAIAAGATKKQVGGAESWSAVAEMIKEKEGTGEAEEEEPAEEEEEAAEEFVPKKGEVVSYKPPKAKKSSAKCWRCSPRRSRPTSRTSPPRSSTRRCRSRRSPRSAEKPCTPEPESQRVARD
jgi:hypothetical protein